MEGLTDEELKKESKQESKNEVISTIIRVSVFDLIRPYLIQSDLNRSNPVLSNLAWCWSDLIWS